MLKCAFLFCRKLYQDLESQGFEVNPYDTCVANKIIKGYQRTLVWHVDDLKNSHKHPREITKLAMQLSKVCSDIKVKCEKKLEYLGMDLDYLDPGKVKISIHM